MSTTPSAAFTGMLPSARHSPAAPSADTARHQVAWQREMERAQVAAWFKPPVAPSPSDTLPNAGRGDLYRQHPAEKAGLTTKASGTPVVPGMTRSFPAVAITTNASIVGPADAPLGEGPQLPPVSVLVRTADPASVGYGNVPIDTPAASRWPGLRTAADALMAAKPADAEVPIEVEAKSSIPPGADPAPVRLHTETRPQGQAVWIALRADDEALFALLPRIVADLQRELQGQGRHLFMVVCNGRLVWRDSAVPYEDPIHPLHSKEA